jgi:hypothetical protein
MKSISLTNSSKMCVEKTPQNPSFKAVQKMRAPGIPNRYCPAKVENSRNFESPLGEIRTAHFDELARN